MVQDVVQDVVQNMVQDVVQDGSNWVLDFLTETVM